MKLPLPQRAHHIWRRADFFDERRKSLFARIAEFKPSDVLYRVPLRNVSLEPEISTRDAEESLLDGYPDLPRPIKRNLIYQSDARDNRNSATSTSW